MRVVWFLEQTGLVALHSINWLDFVTERGVLTAQYELNIDM